MLPDNQLLEETLNEAVINLNKAIRLSLEDLKNNPKNEGEHFQLWAKYSTKVGSFFMAEAERTGNQQLPKKMKKRLVKYFIF